MYVRDGTSDERRGLLTSSWTGSFFHYVRRFWPRRLVLLCVSLLLPALPTFSNTATLAPLMDQWLTQPIASSPTSATSENAVSKIPDSEPWRTGGQGKYQYYPGGDRKAAPKDAPSALHVTIVPDVTLPKHLHDKYNKYGKDGYP